MSATWIYSMPCVHLFFLHYVKVTNKPNVAGYAYCTIVVYVVSILVTIIKKKSINQSINVAFARLLSPPTELLSLRTIFSFVDYTFPLTSSVCSTHLISYMIRLHLNPQVLFLALMAVKGDLWMDTYFALRNNHIIYTQSRAPLPIPCYLYCLATKMHYRHPCPYITKFKLFMSLSGIF